MDTTFNSPLTRGEACAVGSCLGAFAASLRRLEHERDSSFPSFHLFDLEQFKSANKRFDEGTRALVKNIPSAIYSLQLVQISVSLDLHDAKSVDETTMSTASRYSP